MFDLKAITRPNIWELTPYSSARDEFTGEASIFLDANENPFNEPYNRYPDPLQRQLKKRIAQLKGVSASQIFLGNGSDEAIDLLFRAFCEPGESNMITLDPTYGMYQVCADINNIDVKKIPLTPDFQINMRQLFDSINDQTRLIFLCSPNNPTGNLLCYEDVEAILRSFKGLVVVDEAYIDFAGEASWLTELSRFPNLVILQTFSKAWGMAGIRLGMAFATEEVTGILSKIKYPYNINILTQQKALELLQNSDQIKSWVQTLNAQREELTKKLAPMPFVEKIFPSDANFLLVKIKDPKGIYGYLVEEGIIVRDRSQVTLCEGCLRITVGTPEENQLLLEKLQDLYR